MPVNIYDTPADAQFINTYERMPVDMILKSGMAMQGRWDKGEQLRDDLTEALNVDAVKERTLQKREAVNKWRSKIDALIEESGGEYHRALGPLEQLHRELKTELKEGELAGLQKEYDIREAYKTSLAEDETIDAVKAQRFLSNSDYKASLASQRLEQDEYGNWTKGQYSPIIAETQQDLFEATIDRIKEMPEVTMENLGQWLKDVGMEVEYSDGEWRPYSYLPPGMYEAIDKTIKSKGPTEVLQNVLQIMLLKDPKYKDFIDQEVLLKMLELDQTEDVQPGTKERMMTGADLNLVNQLEEAGIDIYSPEGQEALLKAQLEQDFTEGIISDPIQQAILAQGMPTSIKYDRNKQVISDDDGDKKKSDDDDDKLKTFPTPGPAVEIATPEYGLEGDTQAEIKDNILKQEAEIEKEIDPEVKAALEEELQRKKNVLAQMEANVVKKNPAVAKTIAAKPQPPAELDESAYLDAEQYLVDDILGTGKTVRQYLLGEETEKNRLKTEAAVALYDKTVMQRAIKKYEEETGNRIPRDRDGNASLSPELLTEMGLKRISGRTTSLTDPGKYVSTIEPIEGKDLEAIEKIGDYLIELYDWQDDGIGEADESGRITGLNAQDKLDALLTEGGVTEEPYVHRLDIDATKALQTTLDKMTDFMKGANARDFQVKSSGQTGIASNVSFDAFQDKYAIDEDKTQITGFVAPSLGLPGGAFELTIEGTDGKTHNILVSPTLSVETKEGRDYFGWYESLVKPLKVGDSWIEASKGQDLTPNFDLKKKGLTESSVMIRPNYENNSYTVDAGKDKDELDPVTIAEMIHYGKTTGGTYPFEIEKQILEAVAPNLTAEEVKEIEEKGLRKGKGINQDLSKPLLDKISSQIGNTAYNFSNLGQVKKVLPLLDKIGGGIATKPSPTKPKTSVPSSTVLPSENLTEYKKVAKKEAEALGAVEITSNDFDNVTVSDSAFAPYAKPVIKKFLQLVDDAGIAAEIDGLYRTDAYNKALPHSAANSLHKKGLGIDIDVKKGSKKYKDIMALIEESNEQATYTGDGKALTSYIIRDHYHGNPPHLHLEFDWIP